MTRPAALQAEYSCCLITGRRSMICAAALLCLSLVSIILACLPGPLDIPVPEVLRILGAAIGLSPAPADSTWNVVVLDLRLSRVCLAWLVGAGLAVSGATFQGLLRNPLADPFTIGVSSGAAFGASLLLFLAGHGTVWWLQFFGTAMLPVAALIGALGALAAVLILGSLQGGLRRDTLVLAGIVVATFLSALISLLKALDEESAAGIVFWLMGSFQGRGWNEVLLFLPYALLGTFVIFMYARELDILMLGDTQAQQLGMDAARVRFRLLIAASLLAGACVAVSGIIGFVGLIVPHLVRKILGSEHRPLLLLSALTGGVLLLWADVLARSVLSGGMELPAGVVTALLGGPFFCMILARRANGTAL